MRKGYFERVLEDFKGRHYSVDEYFGCRGLGSGHKVQYSDKI